MATTENTVWVFSILILIKQKLIPLCINVKDTVEMSPDNETEAQ